MKLKLNLKRPTPRQTVYILFGIVLVLTAASTVAGLHSFKHSPAATNKTTGQPSTKTKTKTGTKQDSPNTNASAGTSPTDNANSGASASSSDSADTSTTNLACSLLTQSIASEVIGAEAKPSTPADTPALATSGTSVESCAYSSTTGTVQLNIRTADTSLGVSKNATIFGSEKPSNAVNFQNYGDSAYWDPDAHRLNILSSNDWYSIVTSSGSKADAQTIASEVAAQL